MVALWCVLLIFLGVYTSSLLAKSAEDTPTVCDAVPGQPSCVCKTKKGLVNLTSLAKKDSWGLSEVFGGSNFSYNPCYKFDSGVCLQTFICDARSNIQLAIGDSGEEQIYVFSNGTPAYAYYPGTNSGGKVFLHCTHDEKTTFTASGFSQTDNAYRFDLSSCQVCPGGCKSSSVSVGIVGLVLLLVFVAAIVTYFIVGALIMKLKYDAQTFTETVPNSSFWIDAPFLIKDGCFFTVRPILDLIKNRRNNEYEQIK